jgi:hypothetical protein
MISFDQPLVHLTGQPKIFPSMADEYPGHGTSSTSSATHRHEQRPGTEILWILSDLTSQSRSDGSPPRTNWDRHCRSMDDSVRTLE